MVSPHHVLHARSRLSHRPASTQPGRSCESGAPRGKKSVEPLSHLCSFPDPLRLQTPKGVGLLVMVPLSVAEVRRLFSALLLSKPLPFPFRLAWSFFRRLHQAIARRCHYQRRFAALT